MLVMTLDETEKENDMDWDVIFHAAIGRADALGRIGWPAINERAPLPLLLDDAPHPTAAPVAAATGRKELARHAAPTRHGAGAAWRANPQWGVRAFGGATTSWPALRGADMVAALRDDPAALRDAVAIALRDGNHGDVGRAIEALGADGWRVLENDRRRALLARGAAADVGRVWGALDNAQRAAATQAARLIGASAPPPTSDGSEAPWTTRSARRRHRRRGSSAHRRRRLDCDRSGAAAPRDQRRGARSGERPNDGARVGGHDRRRTRNPGAGGDGVR